MFNINNLEEEVEQSVHKAKIKYFMSKHNLNYDNLRNLIDKFTIYLDYDEVLVKLNEAWINYYNERNGTNYKPEDVDEFYWWNNKPNGLDFLNKKEDCYENVLIKENVAEFMKIIKKNEMKKNISIATFSHPNNLLSKFNHIKKHFPFMEEKDVHVTGKKWQLDFNNAVIIEDGAMNAENIVKYNPFAYVLLLNMKHNKNIETGRRIKRIDSILEFFDYLPLIALENYNLHVTKNDIYKDFII